MEFEKLKRVQTLTIDIFILVLTLISIRASLNLTMAKYGQLCPQGCLCRKLSYIIIIKIIIIIIIIIIIVIIIVIL